MFRDHVLQATAGRGVDCVLNSLAGEMMEASLAVVAEFGTFCEIGKYDLVNNTRLGIKVFERNISYHAMDLADMFIDPHRAQRLQQLLSDALVEGIVIPLPHQAFEAVDHEMALRHMASGKHMGKVLVHMVDFVPPADAKPLFVTSGTHILTGGLGGFGLELAQWLLVHGATTVVLTSRRGATEARQLRKLEVLRALGTVVISALDVCEEAACEQLIKEQGTALRGVWHLATVLDDIGFAHMTEAKWSALDRIKVGATEHLDTHTRGLDLDAFVVVSSISSMFGNIGQSNYASANNAAEMLIHRRNEAGYNGLAIQWGAIDNVGVMMQSDSTTRNGFTNRVCEFQNIDHSIASLHRLLQYNGVYSSYEEKRATVEDSVEDLIVSVPRIQMQLARILG